MLEHALNDRKENQNPPQNNHQSKHSIGSILLLVAGFESWINEALAYLSTYDHQFRQKGKLTAIEKYRDICGWDISTHIPSAKVNQSNDAQKLLELNAIKENLRILFEVRNEIAHAMPLPTGTPLNLPLYLMPLHEKGLLITTGKPASDYTLSQKLRSYALAYWCWEVVNDAICFLIKHLEPDQILAWTAQNFSVYNKIACPPEDLVLYDAGKWRRKKLQFGDFYKRKK